MNRNTTQTPNSLRLKRDLDREAVDLALKGEWERATEVNRAVLELFTDDVEAMNRLAKALMELGDYGEPTMAKPGKYWTVSQPSLHTTKSPKRTGRDWTS